MSNEAVLQGPLTIELTQSEIDAGVPCSHQQCPVALAIQELVPHDDCGPPFVYVESNYAHINESTTLIIPEPLEAWIMAFDDDPKKVKPFSINIPASHLVDQEFFYNLNSAKAIRNGDANQVEFIHQVRKGIQ